MGRFVVAASLGGVMALTGCGPVDPLSSLGSFAMISGAIFTTNEDGSVVNGNVYETKEDVWLNGGPPQPGAAGLPDGTYVIGVTDPSGGVLLSPLPLTTVTVSGGEFASRVPLAPFGTSANGVYKVWATQEADYGAASLGSQSGFDPSKSKTDNFRVLSNDDGGGNGGGDDGENGNNGGYDDDADGNGCPDSYGAMHGNVYGNVYGDVFGDIYGNLYGNLHGSLHGNLLGDLYGNVYGDLNGDVWGDVYGNIYGGLNGRLFGRLYGNIHGDVGTGCGSP